MGIWNLTGKRIKNAKESTIFVHLLQCDSPINFDGFDILEPDSEKFRLLSRKVYLSNVTSQ